MKHRKRFPTAFPRPAQAGPPPPQQNAGLMPQNAKSVLQFAAVLGLPAEAVINDLVALGIITIEQERLRQAYVMAAMAVRDRIAQENAPPPEKKINPDDIDPMTPEERLRENQAIARGETPTAAEGSSEDAADPGPVPGDKERPS